MIKSKKYFLRYFTENMNSDVHLNSLIAYVEYRMREPAVCLLTFSDQMWEPAVPPLDSNDQLWEQAVCPLNSYDHN